MTMFFITLQLNACIQKIIYAN